MDRPIPARLVATCRQFPEASAWLARLPGLIRELEARWSLTVGTPFDSNEVSCAWVAPATRADRSIAVLKVGMPHFEAEHELAGLRFWDGDPTVRLIEADESVAAMLLERCVPGTHLRVLRPEAEQDRVIARLLRRLWRRPASPHPFRQLSVMTARWTAETRAQSRQWPDAGLVEEGLGLLQRLSRPAADDVLLATDLHAGNVLQARREPWLVIDPKPFIGDPAYDASQHLLNCINRLRSEPVSTIHRFAELLGVESERVRMWMFARAAAEPRDDWRTNELTTLASMLAP
jgi:streptomycin 6-kinase